MAATASCGDDAFSFVRAHTTVCSPSLIPELRLQLSDDVTELWLATEEAMGRTNLPPPFWAFCWPGSQVIARYLLDHPEAVQGKGVLDFAAGCGVAGIAAARAGAARVTSNEVDLLAAAAILLNAELNEAQLEVALEDLIGSFRPVWEVVLAGDVCYEHSLADRTAAWLRQLARRGLLVLLGDPGRAFLPTEGLVEVARYTVPTSLDLEAEQQRETVLYRVVP
ncbi:MAG: methyltransferase [Deltaproteobacteria bacterium]|nr:methyltransferase [Deltaproteobacteria bacterium]